MSVPFFFLVTIANREPNTFDVLYFIFNYFYFTHTPTDTLIIFIFLFVAHIFFFVTPSIKSFPIFHSLFVEHIFFFVTPTPQASDTVIVPSPFHINPPSNCCDSSSTSKPPSRSDPKSDTVYNKWARE